MRYFLQHINTQFMYILYKIIKTSVNHSKFYLMTTKTIAFKSC